MSKVRIALIALGASLIPYLPLLDLKAKFYFDWNNHLWYLAYFGEYLKNHLWFPYVYNAHELVGNPGPIFYGRPLFAIGGGLATFLGASLAVRVLILGTFLLQFLFTFYAVEKISKNRKLAYVMAALQSWSIYPLTNIYHRSALPEFFAVALLHCLFCLWFLAKDEGNKKPFVLMGLLFGIVSQTHPISGIFGVLIIGPIWGLALGFNKKKGELLKNSFYFIGATALFLSPWIYLLFRLSHNLSITLTAAHIGFFEGIDSITTRLMGFPYDPRELTDHSGSTPCLDAQILLPYLFLGIWLTWLGIKNRWNFQNKISAFVGWILFLFFLISSVSPYPWNLLPQFLQNVQFGYRLVSFINLSLFTLILFLISSVKIPKTKFANVALILLVVFQFSAVLIKDQRATTSYKWELIKGLFGKDPETLLHTPFRNKSNHDYFTPTLYPELNRESILGVDIPVKAGSEFGITGLAIAKLDSKTFVQTNVLAFPWNKIVVDGQMLKNDLMVRDFSFAFELPPGDHTLEYRFEPDPVWSVLNLVSVIGTAFLLLLLIL